LDLVMAPWVKNQGRGFNWGKPINLTKRFGLFEEIFSPCFFSETGTLYFTAAHKPNSVSKVGMDIWQMDILPIVDFNNDGVVDTADINALLDHWGTDDSLYDIGPTPLGDGIVDAKDLVALAEYMVANPSDANDL
jgi:hypothetical protein